MSSEFINLPSKEKLCEKYLGKPVSDLPTPSLIIDRAVFAQKCSAMLNNAKNLGVQFRCHVKTHKTLEGTELELGVGQDGNSQASTSRIVVSTLAEAWSMLPLVRSRKIDDILYGLPVASLRIEELYKLSRVIPHLRLMVDSIEQVAALVEFSKHQQNEWSVFLKVDVGTKRAGRVFDSVELQDLIEYIQSAENRGHVSIFGVYGHSGHSYNTRNKDEAKDYFVEELRKVNHAAKLVQQLAPQPSLTISIGATPTAHFSLDISSDESFASLLGEELNGDLELHAGNYACCDLQQVATGLVADNKTSLFLLAEVLASYPKRNNQDPGEQLINAGVVALGREPGPWPGFGHIVEPKEYGKWIVKSVSQEHGTLGPVGDCKFIPYGTKIKILPQHACIAASAHGWYFIIEDEKVVDVWIPTKFW